MGGFASIDKRWHLLAERGGCLNYGRYLLAEKGGRHQCAKVANSLLKKHGGLRFHSALFF